MLLLCMRPWGDGRRSDLEVGVVMRRHCVVHLSLSLYIYSPHTLALSLYIYTYWHALSLNTYIYWSHARCSMIIPHILVV